MDKLYPEFWAMGWDAIDMGQYNLHNMVSKDVSAEIAKAGTSVDVMLQPDLGDPDAYDGTTIVKTDISQESVKVVLDKGYQKTIPLTSKELSMSQYDLINNYAAPMAQSIIRRISKDVYNELAGSKYFLDATAGLSESLLIDAGTKLSEHDVAGVNRKLAASPSAYGALLKLAGLTSAQDTGDGGAAKQAGQLVNRYGFQIGMDNGISKRTPADLTGAVNGAAAAGVSSLAVDGFATMPSVGDIITSIGADTTKYTITSVSATSIGIYPALAANAADDAVITLIATQSAIAFTPSALGLAMRAWAMLPDGLGVQSQIFDANGIPVRISVWQSDLNVNVQYATLCGLKRYRDERIVRLVNTLG